ncbi:MAG: hypothetical protein MJ099_00795 [Clostridia bacterium]|nr:hypothetical protein [Clostridia bacterium]
MAFNSREAIEAAIREGNLEALEEKAYQCYGGGAFYPCDWAAAEECFLRLMQSDGADDRKGIWANTLGYIYYYGRANGGVPQYDKAFAMYTLGAACGLFESRYKLADMYLKGKGCTPNRHAAFCLLDGCYNETLDIFLKGGYSVPLADVAVRLGDFASLENEDGEYTLSPALHYYLVAKTAIEKRMEFDKQYGDESVARRIDAALERMAGEDAETPFITMLRFCFVEHHACVVTIEHEGNDICLTLKPLRSNDEEEPPKLMFTVLQERICVLTDELHALFNDVTRLFWASTDDTIVCDAVAEKDGAYYFLDRHRIVARIEAMTMGVNLPTENAVETADDDDADEETEIDDTVYRFASVEFEPGGKLFDYLCDDMNVHPGDDVVVLARGEEKIVRVVRVFTTLVDEMPLAPERYKTILRKA